MPHTRRKKPPSNQHKRLQVTDDSGWTHVTTTRHARRVHRQPNSKHGQVQQDEEALEPLEPAEAPAKTSLADLQRQLDLYRKRWEASATWECAVRSLQRALPSCKSKGAGEPEGDADADADADSHLGVSVVCIGLGSPSGFLRGGWVDRRAVSMYQLAALGSIMGWIRLFFFFFPSPFLWEPSVLTSIQSVLIEENTTPDTPKAFAQDPVFNKHDTELLNHLNITVLKHPSAFEKVTPRTFLFCPGAERRHLEILLARDPAFVFGGPLEDIDSEVVREFVAKRESVQLARFEEMETAFWGMRVYYPPQASWDG